MISSLFLVCKLSYSLSHTRTYLYFLLSSNLRAIPDDDCHDQWCTLRRSWNSLRWSHIRSLGHPIGLLAKQWCDGSPGGFFHHGPPRLLAHMVWWSSTAFRWSPYGAYTAPLAECIILWVVICSSPAHSSAGSAQLLQYHWDSPAALQPYDVSLGPDTVPRH